MTSITGRSRMLRRAGVIGAIGLGGMLVARRFAAPSRMPHAVAFERVLAETRGEAAARRLIADAEARYASLRETWPAPANLALRMHLRFLLLPGLALYQTLIETGEDPESAVACLESLLTARVKPYLGLLGLVRYAPNSFGLFRAITHQVVRLGFPTEGWEMEPREDDADAYAYDVRRCFYLDTLTACGAPELTPVFCGGDDLMFSALEPAISWNRAGTLGRGYDRCDFCWRRAAEEKRRSPSRQQVKQLGD